MDFIRKELAPLKKQKLKLLIALTMLASGISFEDAAEFVGMSGLSLGKWRKHRDANSLLN